MDLVVNEDLKAYIDPLTTEEHEALERSLLAEGCRDALVLWGDVLVDGHNRYAICRQHGLPFQTVQNTRFQSLEDVHLWMINQHLGRRSLSDFQRGVLALRKREIVAGRRAQRAAEPTETDAGAPPAAAPAAEDPLTSREALARAARLRSSQVVMIEKIQQSAAPEVVAALKSGTLTLNAAAAVASLPAEEQVAAAVGGKDELKQAAKRVRDARRKPAREDDATASAPADDGPDAAGEDAVPALRQRVEALRTENARLTAENAQLRKQVLALLSKNGPTAAGSTQPTPADTEADAPF